jgi:hypothetical protein
MAREHPQLHKHAVTIMHVFISWSGDRSKQLAEALRQLLEDTLQYVKPYFTPADIDKGAKWDTDISKHLGETDICVIVLTWTANG